MKKSCLFIFLSFFFFMTFNVSAITTDEIKSRTVCSNFELAIAYGDHELKSVACYNTYNDAKKVMNENIQTNQNDNFIILERSNNVTTIIDARWALVYLGVKSIDTNTDWYKDKNLTEAISYMNHHVNYGATDGVFLEFNYENHAIKAITSGVIGWLRQGDYKIIPLALTGNFSYYQVTDKEFIHYYAANIETCYYQPSRVIDKKPTMLNQGRYFSYDGNYFYQDVPKMLEDYQKGTHEHSVNKDKPYYNYYMYLPHRGRTNYTSDDIDSYLRNTRGFQGTIYGKKAVTHYSNLFGTGIFFKSSETLYGANAIMMMALASNESALGQSYLAINKNNLFGHAAYDSSAYDSATGYLNPYQSIIGHANSYINCGYANPTDSRYYGSNYGFKATGMNVKYASDPYWGEKAANYYYEFEKINGFLDYNYYQLGITNETELNVRSEPNTLSAIPYNLKYKNVPVIILDEVTGSEVKGNTKWYKIVADANLNQARNAIASCSFNNYYNWSSYVYVPAVYIDKINTTQNGKYNSNNDSTKNINNYQYKEYSNNATAEPKAGLITNDTTVYYTSTLSASTNKVMKKGHFTTVFMEALDENKKVVAYLVTYDYSKNQKGWVKASDLTITDKDILKVNVKEAGQALNVYNEPDKNTIGTLYTDTYVVIVDKTTSNNNLWLKLCYFIDNTYAWLNTNLSSSIGSLNYTTNKLNQKPVINANDKTVFLNQNYNPLEGVSATDSEDGNITSKLKYNSNVDTKKVGTYTVTYEVTDSKGEKVTKTIKVTVRDYILGDNLFIYHSLKQISGNTFEFKGFLGVKKMNNTNVTHKIVFKNQTSGTNYEFSLEDFKDYPYEVSSLTDDKTYNYKDGWFKGNIDLAKLPSGDYVISIVAHNNDTGYYTEAIFTNLAYQEMPRRIKVNNRGYSFDIDYGSLGSPLVLAIRDEGLISYDVPSSFDPMYNFFTDLKLNNDNLEITGTSHTAGVSYSKSDTVTRTIVFEDTKTFKRYSFEVGYIDNGPYQVTLAVSDNKDKTRAWYQKTINLSSLPKGTYAIYVKTTSNAKTYYGELIDAAYTDFTKINTSKYEFKRVDSKRLRVELTVK